MIAYQRVAAGLVALLLLAMAFGQGGQKEPTPEEAAVSALQKEYSQAMMEYQKPLIEAKTREGRALVKLDPEKHPARTYYPKFKELAVKYGKSDAAFMAWVLTRQTAMAIGDQKGAMEARDAILKDFINTTIFATYLPSMASYDRVPGETPEQAIQRMEAFYARMEKESTNPDVIAAAMAGRASLYRNDPDRAAAINKVILEKYPNTTAGQRAKAAIYEAENLVVGKLAPDFEAIDTDGKKFRLSDYRGKVVVLDFWGFW